jgi:hypothetical protein
MDQKWTSLIAMLICGLSFSCGRHSPGCVDAHAMGMFQADQAATHVALDGDSAYWISERAGQVDEVRRAPRLGGPVTSVLSAAAGQQFFGLAVDGTFLFVGSDQQSYGSNIISAPKAGGPWTTLLQPSAAYPSSYSPRFFALSSTEIGFSNASEVGRVPKTGGTPQMMQGISINNGGGVYGVAWDGNSLLFWGKDPGGHGSPPVDYGSWKVATPDAVYVAYPSTIQASFKRGGPTLSWPTLATAQVLQVGGGFLYWIEPQAVLRANLDGTAVCGLDYAAGYVDLAVDGSTVYAVRSGSIVRWGL